MSITTLCSPNKSTYFSPIAFGTNCPAPNAENLNAYMGVLYNEIIDEIYPVGAHYISTTTDDPSVLFGRGTWELMEAGRTLLGAGTNWIDLSQWQTKTTQDGAKWALIVQQKVAQGGLFTSSNVLNNESEIAWSKLGQIANFYTEAGELEMILDYPSISNGTTTGRWRQKDNPIIATFSTGSSYGASCTFTDPINSSNASAETGLYIPPNWLNQGTVYNFTGLHRSTSGKAFLDGQTGSNWYFACGSYALLNNGIPATPYHSNYVDLSGVSLWVRYDNAAGYNFTTGSIGGSTNVTLNSPGWIPPHRHGMASIQFSKGTDNPDVGRGSSGVSSYFTTYSGSSSAHNNMQPYTKVYIWKRVE